MQYSKQIALNGVVLTQTSLYKLLKKFEDKEYQSEISISFKDDVSFDQMSVVDFKFADFSSKQVDKITIKINHKNFINKIKIYALFDEEYIVNIVTQDTDNLAILVNIVEEWIVSSSKLISLKKIVHSWLMYLFMPLLVAAPSTCFFIRHNADWFASIFMGVFVFMVIGLPMIKFLRYIFPKVEIDIGFNKVATIRKTLGWIIVVLVIPIVINFIKFQ